MYTKLIIAFLVLCLSACKEPLSTEQIYLQRLSNVLKVDVQQSANLVAMPQFPAARMLTLETSQSNLSLREFLSLRECKLHVTLAHRNSLMGKVANQSQLLLSDLRILDEGPKCLEQQLDLKLRNKLVMFLKQKEEHISKLLWFSILGQSEHRQFWQTSNQNLPLVSQEHLMHLNNLGDFVNAALKKQRQFTDADFSNIEKSLGAIRSASAGSILTAYVHHINVLQEANRLIQTRLNKPLCLYNKPTQQARYFDNVVRNFFINEVQSKAVLLKRASSKLMAAHKHIEKPLLASSSDVYKAWVMHRNSIIKQGQNATKQHVSLIQLLYKQCNLHTTKQTTKPN